MDIITGTGRSIWNPGQLTVEAFAALPPTTPIETLGPEMTSGSFTYGCLGACQGGSLMLTQVPAPWRELPFPRLIRCKLDGDRVFAGVLTTVNRVDGQLAEATLLAPHRLYADTEGTTYAKPGLTAGIRAFGVIAGSVPEHTSRREGAELLLAQYPNSEYGIGPDLYAVIGRPESASYADYTVGSSTLKLTYLGYRDGDYVTDAVFDPGEGWRKFYYPRPGVPPFVKRIPKDVRVQQAILKLTQSQSLGSGWTAGNNSTNPTNQYLGPYTAAYAQNYEYIRGTGLTLKIPYTVQYVQARVLDEPYAGSSLTVEIKMNGTLVGSFTEQLLPTMAGLAREYVLDLGTLIEGSGTFVFSTEIIMSPGVNSNSQVVVGGPVMTHTFETPNLAGIEMPLGWDAPYIVGPSWQFKLPGWHVPPFRVLIPEAVCGVPGGLLQYAAAATVTWNRIESSTLITTAARPYPGQRRAG